MKYMTNCKTCMNYRDENIWGNQVQYCAGGVHNPLKCILRKRVLNPEIKEFFEKTCERFRDER